MFPPPPPDASDDWRKAVDGASGRTYYYNELTGETSWSRPSAPPPPPPAAVPAAPRRSPQSLGDALRPQPQSPLAPEDGMVLLAEGGRLLRFDHARAGWRSVGNTDGRITAVARSRDSRWYGVTAGGDLVVINPISARARTVTSLSYNGQVARGVKSLCFSEWLHQENREQLFCLLPAGGAPGVHTDVICSVDVRGGSLEVFHVSRRSDLTAITAPPLAGGPWGGKVFLAWAEHGGLYGVHWANEGSREEHISHGSDAHQVHTLSFSADGAMFAGTANGLYSCDPADGSMRRLVEIAPATAVGFFWEPSGAPGAESSAGAAFVFVGDDGSAGHDAERAQDEFVRRQLERRSHRRDQQPSSAAAGAPRPGVHSTFTTTTGEAYKEWAGGKRSPGTPPPAAAPQRRSPHRRVDDLQSHFEWSDGSDAAERPGTGSSAEEVRRRAQREHAAADAAREEQLIAAARQAYEDRLALQELVRKRNFESELDGRAPEPAPAPEPEPEPAPAPAPAPAEDTESPRERMLRRKREEAEAREQQMAEAARRAREEQLALESRLAAHGAEADAQQAAMEQARAEAEDAQRRAAQAEAAAQAVAEQRAEELRAARDAEAAAAREAEARGAAEAEAAELRARLAAESELHEAQMSALRAQEEARQRELQAELAAKDEAVRRLREAVGDELSTAAQERARLEAQLARVREEEAAQREALVAAAKAKAHEESARLRAELDARQGESDALRDNIARMLEEERQERLRLEQQVEALNGESAELATARAEMEIAASQERKRRNSVLGHLNEERAAREERERALQQAASIVDEEQEARHRAEAEAAALRRQLDAVRGGSASAEERARQEREARERAEQELAALRSAAARQQDALEAARRDQVRAARQQAERAEAEAAARASAEAAAANRRAMLREREQAPPPAQAAPVREDPRAAIQARKEAERARREEELRAATRDAWRARQEAAANSARDLNTDEVANTIVDVTAPVEHQHSFHEGTTYGDAYHQWGSPTAAPKRAGGLVAVAADGALIAVDPALRRGVGVTQPARLACVARSSTGRLMAMSGASLVHVNGETGAVRPGPPLMHEGARVTAVRSLAFSPWLHAQAQEQLLALVPAGAAPGIPTDTLCHVDPDTGDVEVLHATHRHDVLSVASPPLAGGPWGGTIAFLWTAASGLYGVHWANEGGSETHIGVPMADHGIRSICFSADGLLFGASEATLFRIDHLNCAVTPWARLPCELADVMVEGGAPERTVGAGSPARGSPVAGGGSPRSPAAGAGGGGRSPAGGGRSPAAGGGGGARQRTLADYA